MWRVADKLALIASRAENRAQHWDACVEGLPAVEGKAVAASKEIRAVGDGRKTRQIVSVEAHCPLGKAIERRRADPRIAVAPQIVVAKGVADQDDDVHKGICSLLLLVFSRNSYSRLISYLAFSEAIEMDFLLQDRLRLNGSLLSIDPMASIGGRMYFST